MKMTLPREIEDFLGQKQGQTLLVKGRSGTGKTTFALSLLAELLQTQPERFSPKNSVYVSSSAPPGNLRSQFAWAFDQLPAENLLDATPSGPMSSQSLRHEPEAQRVVYSDEFGFVSALNDRMHSLTSGICVIDSLDAIVEETGADLRRLATALTNLGKNRDIQIILTTEGDEDTPLDHIVDGIVCLTKALDEGHVWRSIRIDKLRGVRISKADHGFTLSSNRFQVLQPYDVEQAHRLSTFKVIPHSAARYSSGVQELDDIFGGFRRGSTLFIDVGEGVVNELVNGLILNTVANFLLQDMGVVMVPPNMLSYRRLKAAALKYGFVNQLNSRLRLFVSAASSLAATSTGSELGEPYYKSIAFRESADLENAWSMVLEELHGRDCKALLSIIGFGWLQSWLGPGDLPRWATRLANDTATESNLAVAVGYSSTPEINRFLADIADAHIKLTSDADVTVLHGVNPPTARYCVYTHLVEGKPQIGFQEIA
jgi:KaiC/GvpD/RAD55 family RecA-like ATPase